MGELTVGIHGGIKGAQATVTDLGEIVVAPYSYSTAYYVSVAAAASPYEVVPAKPSHCFVITGLLLNSDKNYGTATAAETLTIYEANAADISVNLKTVTQVDLLRNDRLPVTGLNLLMSQARSIVAIADSAAVDVTIAGYYVPL
jgi:hypothetical protein